MSVHVGYHVPPLTVRTCNGHELVEPACTRCGQYLRNQRTPEVARLMPRIRLIAGGWHCYDRAPLVNGAGA